jgi:hypothetical protein
MWSGLVSATMLGCTVDTPGCLPSQPPLPTTCYIAQARLWQDLHNYFFFLEWDYVMFCFFIKMKETTDYQ